MHVQIHSLLRHSSFSHENAVLLLRQIPKATLLAGQCGAQARCQLGVRWPQRLRRPRRALGGPTSAATALPSCKTLGPGRVLASGETQG